MITQVNFLYPVNVGPDMVPHQWLQQGRVVGDRKTVIEFDDDVRFLRVSFVKDSVEPWQQLIPFTSIVSVVVTPDGWYEKRAQKAKGK